MPTTLGELNKLRSEKFSKIKEDEEFLLQMNRVLQPIEDAEYKDIEIQHPLIFIFGLPRSGTTLIAQLLAHTLDVGYINNFAARFWLAPVHGIKLSKMIVPMENKSLFNSNYATTTDLYDIHEFGYYWRYWLKKDNFAGVINSAEIEDNIDWYGLRKSLANIQQQFNKAMVFKNIFGAYHLMKQKEVLRKVIYVYIKRDPLDVAVSILKAREKFYSDKNIWWSSIPLEYEEIKNQNYWHQIAGQIYYLNRYYEQNTAPFESKMVIKVDYKELCQNPKSVINKICQISLSQYDYDISIKNDPPKSFQYRQYEEEEQLKNKFKDLIYNFEKQSKENKIIR